MNMAEERSEYRYIREIEECLEAASKDLESAETRDAQYLGANPDTQIATLVREQLLDVLRENLETLKEVHYNIRDATGYNAAKPVTEDPRSQLGNSIWIVDLIGAIDLMIEKQEKAIQEHSIGTNDPEADQGECGDARIEIIQASSQGLASIKSRIQEESKRLKIATTSLWRVPAEVWEFIFLLVSDRELDDYLEEFTDKPLRSTAVTLSHVCHYWRLIVQGEPQIWGLVYGPPVRSWLPHEYDRLTTAIEHTSSNITILTNLSHEFPWGYYAVRRYRTFGVEAKAKQIARSNEFGGREFTIHIYRPTAGFDGRIDGIPFRKATTLIITMGENARLTRRFLEMWTIFESLRSLTITNSQGGGIATMYFNIQMSFPNLKVLKIRTKEPPCDFELRHVLAHQLEEFHFHHEIDKPMLYVPRSDIELPSLRTLGVSFSDLRRYRSLKGTILDSLTLYGSPFNSKFRTSSIEDLDNLYFKLSHLCFEGWRKPESPNDELQGIFAILEVLARKIPAMKSIRVSNSFVDGEALVGLFNEARGGLRGYALNHIEELTLSHASGITRIHCEKLSSLVQRVNIYI